MAVQCISLSGEEAPLLVTTAGDAFTKKAGSFVVAGSTKKFRTRNASPFYANFVLAILIISHYLSDCSFANC